MICKILAFFILPYLAISFKMDKKPASKGELANSIDAIQANGHPIRSPPIQFNNVTLESSGRIGCRDESGECAKWIEKRGCDHPNLKKWMEKNCQKSCGHCTPEEGWRCTASNASWDCCTSSSPCREDEGHCDEDSDCEGALVCGEDNCPSDFPSSRYDCCKKPSGGNECAKIPSWMKPALDFNSRIIGGSIAESPIPWQVRVIAGRLCGGTILDEYTILSVAHCKITSDSYIYAGYTSFQSGPEAKLSHVKKVINHPNYVESSSKFDYSIIKLEKPLIFNSYVKPACLPTASFVHGDVAIASGWGKYQPDNGQSDHLRYVGLPLLSQKRCKEMKSWFGLCTGGYDGKEVCKGDSGGPVVVPRSEFDDTAIVIGLPSLNLDYCGKRKPNFFSKVAEQLPWIKANMGKE